MATRREFLRNAVGVAAGAVALPVLQACGGSGGGGGSQDQLEVSWWGGSVRDKLTQKVLKLYEKKHPKENVTGQFAAWSGYWQKLSTLAAGGSLPDVIQMDPSYIGEYTDRGQIMDLTKYKAGLHLDDFDAGQLETGMVNGKLTGVSLGGNIVAMLYNSSALQRAGVQPPADDIDWDNYATYLSQLKKHLPEGVYPADDSSGFGDGLQVWARQRGEMFTKDGKLAATKTVVHDWLQYWADLRKAKLIVPGTVAAEATQIGTPNAEPIVKGQCVFTESYTNFLGQYQVLVKDKIALTRLPQGGHQVGDYVEASMYFSVSSKTSNPRGAVDFVNFFIHDPTATRTLGVDRGVPGSAATRKQLRPSLKPYDAAQIDFIDKVGPMTREKEVDPPSVGEVFDALTRVSQAVSLGKESVDSATTSFMAQAQKALGS